MRLSSAAALLAALAVAAPLGAAAPTSQPDESDPAPVDLVAPVDPAPDAEADPSLVATVAAAVAVPVAFAALGPAAAAAADRTPSALRKIPAAIKTSWDYASGAVKTGAQKAKDYVVAHPKVVAGAAAAGGAAYAAHRYLPAFVERLCGPKYIAVNRCHIHFTKDPANCPPTAYEGAAGAGCDKASDPNVKAVVEALRKAKVSGTITTTSVVSPVGVEVLIPA